MNHAIRDQLQATLAALQHANIVPVPELRPRVTAARERLRKLAPVERLTR